MTEENATDYTFPLAMHELLDRFEILYPTESYYQDLRRAYVDKDISSIFRIMEPKEDFKRAVLSEDLRSILRLYPTADKDLFKAIADENFNSIFRLLESAELRGPKEDFRKAMLEHNITSLFNIVPKEEYGLEDLRKAVIHKNIHSVFRLLPEQEDYRNSILNKELRSIFRVLGYESDLRKLVLDDNWYSLFRLLEKHDVYQYSNVLKRLYMEKINFDPDFFSRGQIKSKLWLEEKASECLKSLGTVYLCAGWYATLGPMLFNSSLTVRNIRSFDVDPSVHAIADLVNKEQEQDSWRFKSFELDIMNLGYAKGFKAPFVNAKGKSVHYLLDKADTVINTSCEHIADFSKWYKKIPRGRTVILQSNNFVDIEEHVNSHSTLEEFVASAPMRKTMYEGHLDLGEYQRFMKIGIK